MKIDILEGYDWTPEWFRMSSGIYRSTGGFPEPPGEFMGLNGPWWNRGGGGQVVGRAPQSQSELGRGAAPPFLPLPLPFLPPPSWTRKGGKPTPSRNRNPPLGRALGGRPSTSSTYLYTGEGHPEGVLD